MLLLLSVLVVSLNDALISLRVMNAQCSLGFAESSRTDKCSRIVVSNR